MYIFVTQALMAASMCVVMHMFLFYMHISRLAQHDDVKTM